MELWVNFTESGTKLQNRAARDFSSLTHSAIVSCATFLNLPHFDVICDLLLTDARQHGIYLFYTKKKHSTSAFSFQILSQLPESRPFPTLANTKKSHLT